MATDLVSSIVGIIIILIAIYVAWELTKIIFKLVIKPIFDEIDDQFRKSINLIIGVGRAAITVGLAFAIVMVTLFFILPNSFYLDIHTDSQKFDLGVPLVEFTGTYEETNAGYIIKPSIYQIPVSSTLTVKQKDKTHLNIFTDFVKAKEQPIKGVIRYVPSR